MPSVADDDDHATERDKLAIKVDIGGFAQPYPASRRRRMVRWR